MGTVLNLDSICGMGLNFTLDGFRIVYSLIACFMWGMTALFSPEYFKHYTNKRRYYTFFWITFFALIGVFLSADLFTTFIFFEIMSFTSYVWVAQDERKESLKAASTYLAVAVIGGLVTLMGLFLMYVGGYSDYLTYGLIFVGFAAKAGVFPLHIWLPKAHPVAPAPASALLSGILTKSGVFGVLILSFQIMSGDKNWGLTMLLFGLVTMVLGAVLALFSIDLKRTLACSSMSQIGFIMTGVGIGCMVGNEGIMVRCGTFLYMINHSLIKLVLFMAAGVVYFNLHKLDLNDIRGFGRNKPLLKTVFLIGALGIAGVPLFNGYVAKTLIHESFEEIVSIMGHGFTKTAEWIFMISGGCTFAYMTKLFIALFIEKNKDNEKQKAFDEKKKYMNKASATALILSAVIIPVFGILPHLTMDRIADFGRSFLRTEEGDWYISYFSLVNLKGAFISIILGVLIYILIVRRFFIKNNEYVDIWPKWADLEELIYRPVILRLLPFVFGSVCKMLDTITDGTIVLLRRTIYYDRAVPREYVEGNTFTHFTGVIMDNLHRRRSGEYFENPLESYEHKLAIGLYKDNLNRSIIKRSLSFGLVMACMGLLITIGYLLYFLY